MWLQHTYGNLLSSTVTKGYPGFVMPLFYYMAAIVYTQHIELWKQLNPQEQELLSSDFNLICPMYVHMSARRLKTCEGQ